MSKRTKKNTTSDLSIQSYAFQLRKLLLSNCALDQLLEQHQAHQELLATFVPLIQPEKLSFSDRFAWKFIREINILSPDYLNKEQKPPNKYHRSLGVYQNLDEIVKKVQTIWFGEMDGPPNTVWLKHFSTRKLAHYAKDRDEIAFSLIFDSPDAPPEILSYLAYHELLHRQVGAKVINGRRYHHTGEFKNQEQLFPNWRDIEDQISLYVSSTF